MSKIMGIGIVYETLSDYFRTVTGNKNYCVDWKSIEIMQYTGLKDKNGVEIYDGDILSYMGAIGNVHYCNETCMYMVGFELHRSVYSFNSMDEEIEVIGNIHDNPELNK